MNMEWVVNPLAEPPLSPSSMRYHEVTSFEDYVELMQAQGKLVPDPSILPFEPSPSRPLRVPIPPELLASDYQPACVLVDKGRHKSPISVYITESGEAKCYDCRMVFHAEVTGERCLCPRCESPRILLR